MKRQIRNLIRNWLPRISAYFEAEGSKGKWFERQYYTYLFTRSKYYSSAEPNPEEMNRWDHIKSLVDFALDTMGVDQFQQIIDFGCGRGWLTNALTGYGSVMGIDPIGKVVQHGRRLYPGLALVEGGIEKVWGKDADLIVCSEVLEHLGRNEIPRYISAFFSGLAENGYLIVTTPRKEAYEDWNKYAKPDQPREEWLSEKEVADFGTDAGFKVIKMLTYSDHPKAGVQAFEIYQQWLFQK